ncbi:metallophosphoesterase [Sphingomonas cavernae]|uniref:Serine/threonine protein phosphatase n=1 Tax=Sphingomonas cavernae TaxID=2320861 RepID=A0A418WL88_9SPHN|nr:metallophosphoesterase [Sphingomonas cavernae]RJF90797.1 serine/threonine protein phosphatase [Sphingomonas cavernae]
MVYSKLARWARTRKAPDPRIPDHQRVYAIGDIHGRLDLFEALIEKIDADDAARGDAQTLIILLGDLVDRGPDSAGVVERAIRLGGAGVRVRYLQGNHEEVFLRAVRGDARAVKFLIRIGGRATLASYGITDEEYNTLEYEDLAALLARRVPAEHIAFLEAFEDLIEVGDYAFVHAGIRPGVELEKQKTADLRWIREEFLNHQGMHARVVVHGHSISEDVERRPNRIGVDTGAFASGRLSAVGLEGDQCWCLSTD